MHTNSSREILDRHHYVIVRSADGSLSTMDAGKDLLLGEEIVEFDELTNAERRELHEILFPRS